MSTKTLYIESWNRDSRSLSLVYLSRAKLWHLQARLFNEGLETSTQFSCIVSETADFCSFPETIAVSWQSIIFMMIISELIRGLCSKLRCHFFLFERSWTVDSLEKSNTAIFLQESCIIYSASHTASASIPARFPWSPSLCWPLVGDSKPCSHLLRSRSVSHAVCISTWYFIFNVFLFLFCIARICGYQVLQQSLPSLLFLCTFWVPGAFSDLILWPSFNCSDWCITDCSTLMEVSSSFSVMTMWSFSHMMTKCPVAAF